MGGGSESVRRQPPTDCHEPSDSRVGCSSRRVIADLEKWPSPVRALRGSDGNRTRLMRPLRTRFFLCSQFAPVAVLDCQNPGCHCWLAQQRLATPRSTKNPRLRFGLVLEFPPARIGLSDIRRRPGPAHRRPSATASRYKACSCWCDVSGLRSGATRGGSWEAGP